MKLHAFLMCWLGLATLSCADDLTRTLQQKLKDQGFYYGAVNGQNSSETSAALRRYQIRYGLRVTGQADAETLRALGVGGSAGPVAAGSTRNAPSAPPMPAPPIQVSPPATTHATPPVTKRVTPPPVATSRATPPPPATDRDVEREPYQGDQDRRQPYEGFDDQDRRPPYGWSDRYGDSSDRSGDTYAPPPPSMRVLPRADSGADALGQTAPGSIFTGSVYERAPRQVQQSVIYTVQELLARRGFYRGDVDGLPGPATSEAIVLFQRDEGLAATGQLDQETLRELRALPGQRNGPPARDAEFAPPEEQRVYRGIWINR
ncbi:MAG: peptidoglycan-binding protein [Verrucomicrobia bacterium]|nr:peptidoglycan-binding protein [Verrucomicrobiota bacterium]